MVFKSWGGIRFVEQDDFRNDWPVLLMDSEASSWIVRCTDFDRRVSLQNTPMSTCVYALWHPPKSPSQQKARELLVVSLRSLLHWVWTCGTIRTTSLRTNYPLQYDELTWCCRTYTWYMSTREIASRYWLSSRTTPISSNNNCISNRGVSLSNLWFMII